MNDELIRHEQPQTTVAVSEDEWSVDRLMDQVRKIQAAMTRAMKSGEHYGVIPGTTGKPTLLKPGAEKLCLIFRLAPSFDVIRRDLADGHVEYEVHCRLTHMPSGNQVGSGIGLCSSMESKYRYRKASLACPECGTSAIIRGKAEYGGGWLCWKKNGGCGAKFDDSHFAGVDRGQVENPNIADTFNTVLKMAKKRALVDATLTATAASDIFTQDLEDMSTAEHTTETSSTASQNGSPHKPHPQAERNLLANLMRESVLCQTVDDYDLVVRAVTAERLTGHQSRTSESVASEVRSILEKMNADGFPYGEILAKAKETEAMSI